MFRQSWALATFCRDNVTYWLKANSLLPVTICVEGTSRQLRFDTESLTFFLVLHHVTETSRCRVVVVATKDNCQFLNSVFIPTKIKYI